MGTAALLKGQAVLYREGGVKRREKKKTSEVMTHKRPFKSPACAGWKKGCECESKELAGWRVGKEPGTKHEVAHVGKKVTV